MTDKTMRSGVLCRVTIVALAAALALSACGRRGELDRPGAAPPPERSASGTLTGGFSDTGGGTDAPPIPPQRRFILDPLLD